MKTIIAMLAGCLFFTAAGAQSKTAVPDSTKKILTVEASCGQCQFKMQGKGCSLAVRIDGKSYFVDGSKKGPENRAKIYPALDGINLPGYPLFRL